MNRIKQLEMGMTQSYPCVGDSFIFGGFWVGVVHVSEIETKYLFDGNYTSGDAADFAAKQEVQKLLEAGAK